MASSYNIILFCYLHLDLLGLLYNIFLWLLATSSFITSISLASLPWFLSLLHSQSFSPLEIFRCHSFIHYYFFYFLHYFHLILFTCFRSSFIFISAGSVNSAFFQLQLPFSTNQLHFSSVIRPDLIISSISYIGLIVPRKIHQIYILMSFISVIPSGKNSSVNWWLVN